MYVTVLGSAGTVPGRDSPCSSYMIEAEGFRLIIDMGNGSTATLQRYCDLQDIDAIVLSHMHGDHWLDLVLYTYIRRYDDERTRTPFPIFAPAGAAELLRKAIDWTPEELSATAYEFHDLSEGSLSIGPFDLTLAPTEHPVEAYAIRVEHEGRSMTYSADTGESTNLIKLAEATDLFICEAALEEHEYLPGIHLTATQAGEHAAKAGAKRLLLTHLRPWSDHRRALELAHDAYQRDVQLAQVGTQIKL